MDFRGPTMTRLVGDYILGPRIGSGSFAVVWGARHRISGLEVAVKEIEKEQLNPKISENLMKEISILSTINHPNIIRLFEAIETSDRIYLVLEYCGGGDLADYIHRCGKVSEAIARHFMRQLAAGLQVLQEKNLIHRDLKPQNLLLATTTDTPIMKIGDFGFARSLTPQGLADTLCGSPYYMAPEIIQSQKYDAKADLWSVGAILYQLVIGRPPFEGNSQLQLFQNILASTELRFPPEALQELHSDCLDLCRSLLRQNPDERLTFEAFFNHSFLQEPRSIVSMQQFQGAGPHLPNQFQDSHLMDSIEKDYVFVNPHFASLEALSDYIETSVLDNSSIRVSLRGSKKTNMEIGIPKITEDPTSSRNDGLEISKSSELDASGEFAALQKEQGNFSLCHSNRLELLHQYVQILAELSQEKYNAGLYPESFAVELVVLATWKKALEICSLWLASITEGELPESSSASESIFACGDLASSQTMEQKINFSDPSSVSLWAKHGFIVAVDRAEKLSCHIQNMDGAAEMPDAMEIIFQQALLVGTSGAVDEYMENRDKAAASYSKAMLLFSFLVGEAVNLPLNPPFSLPPANKERILQYILNLQSLKKSSSKPPFKGNP